MPIQKNDFAIVVGLSQYPLPGMGKLTGPANDAQNVAAWLKREDGGGLPAENVHLVLSPSTAPPDDPFDAKPAQHELERLFFALRGHIETTLLPLGLKGRRLYIFMAGHGFSRDDESASLLAANGDYDQNINCCIDPKAYAQWFRMERYFEEIVLWMDCCRDLHANAMLPQFKWLPSNRFDDEPSDARWFYAFAAKSNAKSRERALPTPSGEAVAQGLFTYALLKGLENAPGDANGNVTCAGLVGYVYKELQDLAGPGKPVQEPYMPVNFIDDIVLVKRAAPAQAALSNRYKVTFAPPAAPPSATVDVWDAHNTHIGTYPASVPLRLDQLPVGLCGLQRSDGAASGFQVMNDSETVKITLDWNGESLYDRW